MFFRQKAPAFHSQVSFDDKGIAVFSFINPDKSDSTLIRFYLLKSDPHHVFIISMPQLILKELFRMGLKKYKTTSDNKFLLAHLLKIFARRRLIINPSEALTNKQ